MSFLSRKRPRLSSSSSSAVRPKTYTPKSKNPEQQKVYSNLMTCKMRSTLYYDEDVCAKMGVSNDVRKFAKALGFEDFMDQEVPNDWVYPDKKDQDEKLTRGSSSYRMLTAEFIATFECELIEGTTVDERYRIHFQMFNKEHSFTLEEFNAFFGFDDQARGYLFTGGDLLTQFNEDDGKNTSGTTPMSSGSALPRDLKRVQIKVCKGYRHSITPTSLV